MHKAAFRQKVWSFYKRFGRHTLPWRVSQDPYAILVSEIMLQQTQVERVLPKYVAFMKKYPTVLSLAQAPLREVLTLWVGLGYNRRAKFLKQAAEAIVERGAFPTTEAALRTLPGVGPYTAAAVCAFAYNQPVQMIETNIRTVFTHHFFPKTTEPVSDAAILKLVAQVLPERRAREWYAALMDYGVFLKKTHGSINRLSLHYRTQSAFKGSDRQIRGRLIKTLTLATRPVGLAQLKHTHKDIDPKRLGPQLRRLMTEGLVVKHRGGYRTAT